MEPLNRALREVHAWASGLRRHSGPARDHVPKFQVDRGHGGILKLNPLADWSREQVWAYVEAHHVPVHRLYGEGYTSIGCVPCTRPMRPGEDERAGRWWWEASSDRECGLHHATPSERFEAALTSLHADLAASTDD